MVHNTRSSRKAKDDENNNGKPSSEKGSINLGSSVSDTSPRRSARETPSKKKVPSPLSTRRSERLERCSQPTPAVKRKSERIEKQKMPSPLRRSERTKKRSYVSSSDSKSLGSSDSKLNKPKKQKSVKQLTFEAKEVSENEEHDVGTSHEISKSRDARAYRAMFKIKARTDFHEEQNGMDNSVEIGGNSDRDKIDECFKGSQLDCKEVSDNGNHGLLPFDDAKSIEMRSNSRLSGPDGGDCGEISKKGSFSLVKSNAPTNEASGEPETLWADCSGDETLQMLASRNCILDEELVSNSVGYERGEKLTPKRNTIVAGKHSDSSARILIEDNCGLIVADKHSDSKRIRVDHDLIQEGFSHNSKESVNPCAIEKLDRGRFLRQLYDMPGGISSAFGVNNLDALNKLREHWLKGQNAVVIDDHDRIVKVIAFILSLHSDANRPFLIVSTSAALHSWRDEFSHLAPSVNVVVYSGIKEMHKNIRRLEYYDEGGCILFQVLIVVPEIIIEDLDVLGGIRWEAIIVDECQCSEVSSYFKQIKMLNTNMRVLLFSGELEDSIVEYHNILAMLVRHSDNEKDDGLTSNATDSMAQLKERLLNYIAYRCKFVEYWVPVQSSNVQLEQYCSILLSNASVLRSSSKSDVVGALHDILISTRKCCNHPFIVDKSLQVLLTKDLKGVEYLDVEIKASGKLQLLDSMLAELKKQGLRGLVLFQSIGGSGRDSMGDILEDFLRLRFGENSYERIDKGVQPSKKLAALKFFNDKNSGRFILLLETCACLSSIKLSSVDAVIIFDSDWNPVSDRRSLQKITFDSQFKQIKIFRLYSSLTVEERALIFAKHDKALDSNLHNIGRSASHMLLMWGASALFDDLKAFHDGRTCDSSLNSLSENLLLKAVHEFSSLLSKDGDTSNCSILLKVQQVGATYHTNSSLIGEQKIRSQDEGPSHIFWTKLLEGKHPQWKYSCGSSQRSRKRVQHFHGLVNKGDFESEIMAKKCGKMIGSVVDQPSSNSEGNSGDPVGNASQLLPNSTACVNDQMPEKPQGNEVAEQIRKLRDEQRSLHLSLKPEIAKLCEILQLPDNVKSVVYDFLKYVMNYHHVNREPVSVLQAFQISLCWAAASFLKHKIDRKASHLLAKQHLNFDCKKEEADYIYSMLRCLKNIFLYHSGYFNVTGSPQASKISDRFYSCTGMVLEVELAKKDISKSIKEIEKKCQKKLSKLILKQKEEKQKLNTTNEEEKADLEREYRIESAVIRSCTPNDLIRTEKLKMLDTKYAKRVEEMNSRHEILLTNFEAGQLEARKKFEDREIAWVEEVESWGQAELLNRLPLQELRTGVGTSESPEVISPIAVPCSIPVELQTPLVKLASANEMETMALDGGSVSKNEEHNRAENLCNNQVKITSVRFQSKEWNSDKATNMSVEGDVRENSSCDNCRVDTRKLVQSSSDGEICDGEASDIPCGRVALEVCKTSSSTDVLDGCPSSRQGELERTASSMPDCGFSLGEVKAASSADDLKNVAALNSLLSEANVPSQTAMCMPNCGSDAEDSEADDNNGSNNAVILSSPLSNERNADGATVSVLDKELNVGMPGTVNFTDSPDNVIPANPPSSGEQSLDGSMVNVLDGELLSRLSGIASPSGRPDTISFPKSSFSDEPILNGVSLTTPDGQIPVDVQETGHEVTECNNDIEHQTNYVLLDKTTTSDHQEEVSRSINENTFSLESPVLSLPSVQPLVVSSPAISVNEELQDPCTSSFSPRMVDNDATVGEMQNFSQPFEQAFNLVDAVPANQMNHESLVIDPPEQVRQPQSAESPSSNQDTAGALQKSSQQVELISRLVDARASQSNHESQVMEPLEQPRQLPSAESPSSNHETAEEMRNSGQQVQTNCNAVVVPTNQSYQESLFMEPVEQGQQSASLESPSSNEVPSTLATRIEHQPINEDSLSGHVSQTSIEVSNQAAVQLATNSVLDSHTAAGGFRMHSSDTRNMSNTSDINNRPIQTATQSASRMPLALYSDPLKNELERIRKETEQTMRNLEDMKLQLKIDCEKEIEEIRKKYDIKLQEVEFEFQQKKKNLDANLNIVLMNKILAEAYRSKCMDLKVTSASGMWQDASFAQQLVQLSRQQSAIRPSSVTGGPPASLPSVSTIASSQTIVPPIQAAYNTSGIFSSVSTRPPHLNLIPPTSGSHQAGSEIRAPAPHLQSYRPSTSMPTTSLSTLPHAMSSQQAPTNIPATSPSHLPPQQTTQTYQTDPHDQGHWPENVGVLPTPNLSARELRVGANSQSGINLPNVQSHTASLDLSEFGTVGSVQANPVCQPIFTDLVCLSDDE